MEEVRVIGSILYTDVLNELGFDSEGVPFDTDDVNEQAKKLLLENDAEPEVSISSYLFPEEENLCYMNMDESMVDNGAMLEYDAVDFAINNSESESDVSVDVTLLLDPHEADVRYVLKNVLDTIEKREDEVIREDVDCTIKGLLMKVAKVIKPNTSFRTPDDIATKNRLKYPVLQRGCSHVHKSKNGFRFCEAGTVSEKLRDTVNRVYWEKSFDGRRQWLDSYVTVVDAKRVAMGEKVNNREASLQYFLPTEHGAKVRVCKPMFLSTLGWRSDKTVIGVCKG